MFCLRNNGRWEHLEGDDASSLGSTSLSETLDAGRTKGLSYPRPGWTEGRGRRAFLWRLLRWALGVGVSPEHCPALRSYHLQSTLTWSHLPSTRTQPHPRPPSLWSALLSVGVPALSLSHSHPQRVHVLSADPFPGSSRTLFHLILRTL